MSDQPAAQGTEPPRPQPPVPEGPQAPDGPQAPAPQPAPGPQPPGTRRREPPLVAFGIVIGTAAGGIAGLLVGAFMLGAGIGCAAGVIVGAVAQGLHGRHS